MTILQARNEAVASIRIEKGNRGGVICPICGKALLYDKARADAIAARCVTIDGVTQSHSEMRSIRDSVYSA